MSDRKLFSLFLIAATVFAMTCLTGCNIESDLSKAQQACRTSGGRLASYQHEYGNEIKFTCSYDGGNYHEEHATRVEHSM